MVNLLNRWDRTAGIDDISTVEETDNSYAHLERCDPATDMVMVESEDGRLAGYTRVTWWQVEDGERVYATFANVDPDWMDRGVFESLIDAAIARATDIAASHDVDCPKLLEGWAETRCEPTKTAAYRTRGYAPITYEATMVRPNLDEIGLHPLEDGLEIRPVDETHLRAIFDADSEAFRDHWGYVAPSQEEFEKFCGFPYRDESLWKVAWDGDAIAGQVRSFINPAENEAFGRRRGWTEFISTGRAWRRKGVARALIAASLRELRARGMTEAALGVHTENPNGAFALYESMGYVQDQLWATLRRPV